MIPVDPPGTPPSERKVYLALQNLPPDWTVIHSVQWHAHRKNGTPHGEADFVLIHPRVGILVLEVKGGGVRATGKQWFSIDGDGAEHPIANPFEQANESKFVLLHYLKEDRGYRGWLTVGHGVVFPDLESVPHLGPDAPPELVITRKDMREDITAAVLRVAEANEMGMREPLDVAFVTDAIAPAVAVRPTLRDDVAQASARLLLFTADQLKVLHGLRHHRRALILGGAGTGKTVLAAAKAKELAATGKRILLTCFNRPLAEHLANDFADEPNVDVKTFHAYCRQEILAAGHEFPSNVDVQDWWDHEAPTRLAVALEASGRTVDAIVADEGQDFAPDWFEALHLALADRDGSHFYVFADTHQAIYRDDWQPPFDGYPYELDTNCRNTMPIAIRVNQVLGLDEPDVGVPGPDAEFVEVHNTEGLKAALPGILHSMINNGGLSPDQVVILTQRKSRAIGLRGSKVAGVHLVDPGGSGVAVETIHRFKGLEADAVIVVLDKIETDRDRALAYIGMSRAKSVLCVIGFPGVGEALGWE